MKTINKKYLNILIITTILLSLITACSDNATDSYSGITLISNGAYGSPEINVAYNGDDITMIMSTQDAGTITAVQYKTEYMPAWGDATLSGENFTCTITPTGYNNTIGWIAVNFKAQNDSGKEFTLEKNAPVYATPTEIEGAGNWIDLALQDLKTDSGLTFTFTLNTTYDSKSYQAVVVTESETDTIHVRTQGKQNPTDLHEHTHFIDPVMTYLELRAALKEEWFGDDISADSE